VALLCVAGAALKRLLVSVVVAFGLGTLESSESFASVGCSALNAGAWNVSATRPSGNLPTQTFSVGEKITFVLGASNSGHLRPQPVNLIEPIGYPTGIVEKIGAATFSYTVVAGQTSLTDTLDLSAFNGGTVTLAATCTSVMSGNNNTDGQSIQPPQWDIAKTDPANSAPAISDGFGDVIGNAFSTGGASIRAVPGSLTTSFATQAPSNAVRATDQAFSTLSPAASTYTKAPPGVYDLDWNAWVDARATSFDQNDTRGTQFNFTSGIGRSITSNLLIGVLTGYQHLNLSVDSLTGKMSGDGGTVGAYAAYRFIPNWSADGMIGRSDIWYAAATGTASGSFTGSRWLGSSGLTGNYQFTTFMLEPSARIFTLQEGENAWTDSLGISRASRLFMESRVSTGGKLTYPWEAAGMQISPYIGSYGDYRFSTDNSLPVDVPSVGLKDGWSGRATTGVTFAGGRGGPSFTLGGELGGIGAGYDIWSATARLNLPF
jgi:hypothetical protein